jgi:CRISPR-associated protein Csb2
MTRFALAMEYLTGYAVATDPANREKPEWPPHPARVFMALAAAHFETDDSPENKQAERAALEWLAALDPPALALPEQAMPAYASPRESLTVYVPVNDATGIETLPAKRPRQPRMFTRVFVGNDPIRFIWSTEGDSPENLDALELLCRKVTRIGHSSSLVWVRLERNFTAASITHEPREDSLENRLRITSGGALDRLKQAYNADNIQTYQEFEGRISAAKSKKDTKATQQEISERFPMGRPASQRPLFSISRGYGALRPAHSDVASSPFDPNLLVLKEADDSPHSFGLESTLLITQALRGLIQKKCGTKPVPDWVSGHDGPDGPKLADGRGHIALIPLPFVQEWRPNERQYADGHIMGVAIVIPHEVPARERAKVFAKMLFDEKTNEPNLLPLKLGRAGEFHVQRETSFSPKRNLQPMTWTRASRRWASATPVVLDRIPKTDRLDRQAWNEEVAGIICSSCTNQKLPEPISVRIEKNPLFVGSLRARPGQGGFPQFRPGTFQVHVAIDFDVEVQGPILLGAGRFFGYGLCRPMHGEASQ